MTNLRDLHEDEDEDDLTLAEEAKVDLFFGLNKWLVAPGSDGQDEYSCYYWENFSEALKFYEENPDRFIYTLVEAEDQMYIVKGAHFVNRYAYLIGLNDVDMGPRNEIRLW